MDKLLFIKHEKFGRFVRFAPPHTMRRRMGWSGNNSYEIQLHRVHVLCYLLLQRIAGVFPSVVHVQKISEFQPTITNKTYSQTNPLRNPLCVSWKEDCKKERGKATNRERTTRTRTESKSGTSHHVSLNSTQDLHLVVWTYNSSIVGYGTDQLDMSVCLGEMREERRGWTANLTKE
jgi:hypothetical protein